MLNKTLEKKSKSLQDKVTFKDKQLNDATIEMKNLKETIKSQEQELLQKRNSKRKEKILEN